MAGRFSSSRAVRRGGVPAEILAIAGLSDVGSVTGTGDVDDADDGRDYVADIQAGINRNPA